MDVMVLFDGTFAALNARFSSSSNLRMESWSGEGYDSGRGGAIDLFFAMSRSACQQRKVGRLRSVYLVSCISYER